MITAIGPHDAEALLRDGSVDLVDVREEHEFAEGHLPGARLVPLAQLVASWDAAGVGPRVLFVCARGPRSLSAAEHAVSRGLTDVRVLEGGTAAWQAAGLPVEAAARTPSRAPAPPNDAQPADGGGDSGDADPELDAVVSRNVRTLRAERGLTLDALAGLSGVGRQTLGQIELGRTVPSVATLWKIAGAFGVPFATLLARADSAATRVLRAAAAKKLVSADGRFTSRALFAPEQEGRVEFYELWLAGHGREDAEAHAPGTRENLVVVSGRVALEIGRERHELAKGDAIVFGADVAHAYVNLGSDECVMHLVMTYGG